MNTTRRRFLKTGASLAAASFAPWSRTDYLTRWWIGSNFRIHRPGFDRARKSWNVHLGEGDVLNIHSGEKGEGALHVVHMHRKPINAPENADDASKITFDYEPMKP